MLIFLVPFLWFLAVSKLRLTFAFVKVKSKTFAFVKVIYAALSKERGRLSSFLRIDDVVVLRVEEAVMVIDLVFLPSFIDEPAFLHDSFGGLVAF